MTLWMVYATLVMLLLGAAAAALEPSAAERRAPARLLWAVVLTLGATLGLAAPLLVAAASPASSTGPAALAAADGAAASEATNVLYATTPPADAGAPAGDASQAGNASQGIVTTLRGVLAPAAGAVTRAMERVRTAARHTDGAARFVWLVGSSLFLLGFCAAAVRTQRLRNAGRMRRVRGLHVVVDATRGPAAAGVIRPWIILPAWSRHLPSRQRRWLRLHEVEHLRGRDPLLKLLGAWVLVLMPWNPAAWWALRRLHLAIETDCDARVVRRSGSPGAYARFLLDMASVGRRAPALVPGAVHFTGNLERRVLAMTNRPHSGAGRHLLRITVAMLAVAAVAVLDIPGMRVFGQAASESALPSAPAATGSVAGTVLDHDGAPVVGARISVVDANVGAVTDRQGRFLLPRLAAGDYTLHVTAQGYRTQAVENVAIISGYRARIIVTVSRTGQATVPVEYLPAVPAPPATPAAAPMPAAAPGTEPAPRPTAPALIPAPATAPPSAAPTALRPVAPPLAPGAAPPHPAPLPGAPPAAAGAPPAIAPARPPALPPGAAPPATVPAPAAAPAPAPAPATPPAPPALAPAVTRTMLTGQVTDAAGDPLSAVQIRVSGTQRGTVTNHDGRYLVPLDEAGSYTIIVSAPGFRTLEVTDITVAHEERTRVDLVLEPSG
jgi:beta-lactamase regulating signal transducer with metallopeptidase domain